MNAAMFGMIIPDRNVPNFCTWTLVLDFFAGAADSVLTAAPLPLGDLRPDVGPRASMKKPPGGWYVIRTAALIQELN